MKFDVLTLFPEMFEAINTSIIGRAKEKNLLEINYINIRDFSKDKHKKVDDTPYGGGAGMVMKADVVYDAYKSIENRNAKVIYMSPQGTTLNQEKVVELSKEEHLIILCGHYEGIDQRVIDKIVDEEISIGDYVLTGGEIPAMVLIDSVSRYKEGVISKESIQEESFSNRNSRIPTIHKAWNIRRNICSRSFTFWKSSKYLQMEKRTSFKNYSYKKTRFIKWEIMSHKNLLSKNRLSDDRNI